MKENKHAQLFVDFPGFWEKYDRLIEFAQKCSDVNRLEIIRPDLEPIETGAVTILVDSAAIIHLTLPYFYDTLVNEETEYDQHEALMRAVGAQREMFELLFLRLSNLVSKAVEEATELPPAARKNPEMLPEIRDYLDDKYKFRFKRGPKTRSEKAEAKSKAKQLYQEIIAVLEPAFAKERDREEWRQEALIEVIKKHKKELKLPYDSSVYLLAGKLAGKRSAHRVAITLLEKILEVSRSTVERRLD